MQVSWKHNDAVLPKPLTFADKVEIFYEQTLGWQLHIADIVSNGGRAFDRNGSRDGDEVQSIQHSGFAVLHICLSYFELIGSLLTPGMGSKASCRHGVELVFPGLTDGSPESDQFLERLYTGARCGLYHEGRTRPQVGLTILKGGYPIAHDATGTIAIDPHGLPRALKAHLEVFRRQLLDQANDALRRHFESRFDAGFS
jgi:hypothetical protein